MKINKKITQQFAIDCEKAIEVRKLRIKKYNAFQDALYEEYPKDREHRLFAANYEGNYYES